MFRTARLDARPIEDADIDGLLDVYLSNPAVLAVTEGSAGEPGHYDRGMLERDLWMSELDPARHTAGLFLQGDGTCVGVLDWVDANPADDLPWIGLVMVHAARQRHGYGREALLGLFEHGRAHRWERVRAAALVDDAAATALLRCAGMREIERRPHRFAAGERLLAVAEIAL